MIRNWITACMVCLDSEMGFSQMGGSYRAKFVGKSETRMTASILI